ncbi:5580_t:CDS:1, partial [Paraglomus brasilianum]
MHSQQHQRKSKDSVKNLTNRLANLLGRENSDPDIIANLATELSKDGEHISHITVGRRLKELG